MRCEPVTRTVSIRPFMSFGRAPVPYAPIVIGAASLPVQLAINRSPVSQTHPRLKRTESPGCKSASFTLARLAHAESCEVPEVSSAPWQSTW